MEDRDLNRHVTSLAKPVSLYNIPCSVDDARLELTLEGSKNQNLGLVYSPTSSSRQDHPWDCNYGLGNRDSHHDIVSRENDQILMRAREDFAKQSMKRSTSNHTGILPNEVSVIARVNGDKVVTNNATIASKRQLKISSQSIAKRTPKGKGIVTNQNGKTTGYDSEVKSTADESPRSKNDRKISHGVLGSSQESNRDGISLREWLKSESAKVDKFEKLRIFRHIVSLVDFAHSQGSSLLDLRPSCFIIMPSNKIKYTGSLAMRETTKAIIRDPNRKRPLLHNPFENNSIGVKQQKLNEATRSLRNSHKIVDETEIRVAGLQITACRNPSNQNTTISHLEKEWYTSPDTIEEGCCAFLSNVYGLGVLLFELLCSFESWESHLAVMSNLQTRILPGNFLSRNPIESAFCLRLLHPDISSRPTTSEILQFELLCGSQDSFSVDATSKSADDVDPQSELLLKFFGSLKEEKESRAAKLLEDIGCLEEDIKEVERKYLLRTNSISSNSHKKITGQSAEGFHIEHSRKEDDRLMNNINQLENAYFSMRSRRRCTRSASVTQFNKDLQTNEHRKRDSQNGNGDLVKNKTSDELVENFFDGICKFSRFNKFKVCGTLRSGDLFNSTNAICSLSFDRDEEYIAAAKVSKKIKIFEFGALLNDSKDIHYPVVEMSNKSKLSSICWNYYIKNYLASADYDGVIKMWDASTGEGFAQYTEHQKRAWSVDFSRADPTMFASGSDDCSVRLWSVNEKNSIGTIWSPANVCCVQFSDYSRHQLVFGSADYKIYGYDLRHIRNPQYTLAGHKKAVSYVKFVDAETLVSASTDNTLKLWDLKKNAPTGVSDGSCSLTFTGHANEKNFVGLSVLDGYIVCGSETNEVYSYYKSLPMPITSHKFKTVDPVSGDEITDDNGQFVSSVCWRRKSDMVVAANSSGVLKLLQMV